MSVAVEGLSIGRRIVRAGIVVSAAHVLFKVAGLIQAKAMGHYLDARVYDVVYALVFEGCLFSIFLMGEEVIGPTFLPVFMRELDTRDERAAWSFANTVLTLQFLLLAATVSLIMLFPGAVIRLLTAWDESGGPKFELAKRALVAMAPALLGLSLGSTTYVILNGYKSFFLAAFGDAAWKFAIVATLLVGVGAFGGADYRAVIAGVLVGSVAKVATHAVGLRRALRHARPSLRIASPAVRDMALLMLPLILGIVFAKARDVFNNVWVLTHLQADGLLQANSFGRKLYVSIGWLVPYALSIAMFPFLCELLDRNDRAEFGRILSRSGRMLLSVFVPLSMVCAALAEPMTSVLFRGGKFSDTMAHWTGVSMACYTLVLPASALEFLLMQAFFAQRKMISVTVVGVVFSALSMGVSYVGIVGCGADGTAALAIIALGFTVSRVLKTVSLTLILKRSVRFFPARETASFLGRVGLVGTGAAGACWGTCRWVEAVSPHAGRGVMLLETAGAAAVACAVFLALVRVLGVAEPAEMADWALKRIRRLRPGGSVAA